MERSSGVGWVRRGYYYHQIARLPTAESHRPVPGPHALHGPCQVDPLGPTELGPEIPGLPDARGERPDRVIARIDPLLDLVPGDRRRGAREGAGPGAVGGRQALAADVLQVVDV